MVHRSSVLSSVGGQVVLKPGGGGRRPETARLHAAFVSSGVYAFGFLFMLPQLFVNYKVRRVPASLCRPPRPCAAADVLRLPVPR